MKKSYNLKRLSSLYLIALGMIMMFVSEGFGQRSFTNPAGHEALSSSTTEMAFRRQGVFPAPIPSKAKFDVEYFWNVEDTINAPSLTGVVWTGTEWWISRWNSDTIYTLDANGGNPGRFIVAGVSNTRSLTTDGTLIYAGGAGSTISSINPTTKTLVSTITLAAGNVGARMCAYDPNADSGNGGFWIGNFGPPTSTGDIQLVSMSGAILTTVPAATHGFTGMYGGAVDTSNVDGPYLLVYHQGPPASNSIGWLDLNTLTPETYIFNVNAVLSVPIQPAPNNPIAGGLYIDHTLIPGQTTMYAVSQGHELTAIEAPDSLPTAPPPPPPANDDICNAQEIIVGDPAISADNSTATKEPGEPAGSCWFMGDTAQNTVWYYFVAVDTFSVTVTTNFPGAGTNTDTQLGAYSSTGGCNGTLSEIACNDDVSGTNLLSTMIVSGLTAGDTVWVQVDGWNGSIGTFDLEIFSNAPTPSGVSFFDFETETSGTTGNLNNGWVAASSTTYEWIANSGPTTSAGTGPDVDHTLGTAAGIYMYTEASGLTVVAGDTAILTSPYIVIDTFTNPGISFWSHRFGATMGDMEVLVNDGTSGWTVLTTLTGTTQTANADPYINVEVPLCTFASADSIRIRFRAIRGSSWSGDMAIDDVGIVNINPSFDAAIISPDIGPTYYTIVPDDQQNIVDFSAAVANVGSEDLTNIQFKASINTWADSTTTASLNCGSVTAPLTVTGPAGPYAIGTHTVVMEASMTQTDANPADNITSLDFEISDSVYARDNGTSTGTLGIGAGSTGTLGQTFEVLTATSITSVSFFLGSNAPLIEPVVGDVLDVSLYDFTTAPQNVLSTTASLTVPTATPSWYTLTFPSPVALTPGTYFLGVNEGTPNNVVLGTHPFNYQPNTGWVIFGANPWAPSEAYGFEVAYLLRANFGDASATISNFNLASPSDGSFVDVSGSGANTVTFDWQDASVSGGPAATYEFLLDAPGGDFSAPLFTAPSDNGGATSQITLTMAQLDAIISNNLSGSVGDTVQAIWQARASSTGASQLAVSDFDVSFDYGIVGLDRALMESSIGMFPNPADRALTIEIENDLVTQVSIQNSLGQTMISDDWNGNASKVYDLSGLSSGIYFVKFHTAKGDYSKKLIVQ